MNTNDTNMYKQKQTLIMEYNINYNKLRREYKKSYKNDVKYYKSLQISNNLCDFYIIKRSTQYKKLLKIAHKNFKKGLQKVNSMNYISNNISNNITNNTQQRNALIIGINYTNTKYQLSGAINDALNMNTFLQLNGYKKKNIVLLTDQTKNKPTRNNIIIEFTNLLQKSYYGDTIILYYSGHGTQTDDDIYISDENDGKDELIVPIDFNCIKDDELKNIIDTHLKIGVKLLIFMDCCFSGTIFDLKYNYMQNNAEYQIETLSTKINNQVILISGCTDQQYSKEIIINDNDNTNINYVGAMSNSFTTVVQQYGKSISIRTLIESMRNVLEELNVKKQTIQLSSAREIDIDKIYVQDII